MSDDFRSYFDSYTRLSPRRIKFLEKCQKYGWLADSGFANNMLVEKNSDGTLKYETVTPYNHPIIYESLKEECNFRGVPMPACYLDSSGDTKLGKAWPELYSISIEKNQP